MAIKYSSYLVKRIHPSDALICRNVFYITIAAELKINRILKKIYDTPVHEIEEAFTPNNLCRCENPVTKAFEVSQAVSISILLYRRLGPVQTPYFS